MIGVPASSHPAAPQPPAAVLDVVAGAPWHPVASTSRGGARVWRVGDLHVKLVPSGSPGPSAVDEAERLDWLQGRIPAPEVVAVAADDAGGWLVSRTVPGTPAHRAEDHPDVDVLVHVVADTLRRLHGLPVESCPFDAGWSRLDDEVTGSLRSGLIDTGRLDPPFNRYGAERLVELWRQGRPDGPEDLVVVHGDPSLPNLVVDGPSLTGLVDVGRLGVGDRHLDLAVVHQSLQRNLGPQAVFAFYDAYGTEPDLVRLEHYRLGGLLR